MGMTDTWATAPTRRVYVPGTRKDGIIRQDERRGWSMTSAAHAPSYLSEAYSATCATILLRIAPVAPSGPPKARAIQSTSEQVRQILDFFGFSKSELAKIMAVSRPALYAWLDGESEPARENSDRLGALAVMALDFDGNSARPLFHGYIDRPIPGYSMSLLEMLAEPGSEPGLMRTMVEHILSMTRDREKRIADSRDLSGPPLPSHKTQDRNLEDNLSAIGAEG